MSSASRCAARASWPRSIRSSDRAAGPAPHGCTPSRGPVAQCTELGRDRTIRTSSVQLRVTGRRCPAARGIRIYHDRVAARPEQTTRRRSRRGEGRSGVTPGAYEVSRHGTACASLRFAQDRTRTTGTRRGALSLLPPASSPRSGCPMTSTAGATRSGRSLVLDRARGCRPSIWRRIPLRCYPRVETAHHARRPAASLTGECDPRWRDDEPNATTR